MVSSFLACAGVTIISAAVSLGFSVAAVRTAPAEARGVALYATSRSAALLIAGLLALAAAPAWLAAIALTMVLVQAGDAAIGARSGSLLKTAGPAATAIFNLAALLWMMSTAST
ncbi:hypothetical protein [Chelatococcus asaccharovorans]|uniref:hypothetical protein n=1 Tax=Chelatococcus asaccharovorans TaxID=28210 RepID=UPI00224C7ABB|nr:hypothetical protein [Chelatococcus asaccharovorans]CAH1666192.1 conserved membrane hypothetical protein [Chelatococcus asaccharovorans]CAH1681595.1 conserved membrane hypothetical protein [Chelatococcus asaccharovorans]